ncbi:MAG: hypothetical protein KC417_03805 [Myxococcales bacterium]|nr:hypothetical protein [Myxococcales bacterium]
MRPPSRALVFVALFLLSAIAATPAEAWTKSRVTGLEAQLDVDTNATARVTLRVGVEVQGGWLHQFELAGLDAGFQVPTDVRPKFVATDDPRSVFHPEVQVDDTGAVTLLFERKHAPHRGTYDAFFTYDAPLTTEAGAEGRVTRWTLPAWSVGLEDVRIRVTAPNGSTLLRTTQEELDGRVRSSMATVHGRSELTWRRVHLPQTVAWTVAFVLPPGRASTAASAPLRTENDESLEGGLAGGLGALHRSHLRETNLRDRPVDVAVPWFVALVLVLVVVTSTQSFRRCVERRTGQRRPALGAQDGFRFALIGALALTGAWAWPLSRVMTLAAFAGVLAVAFERRALRAPRPATLGRWVEVGADERARAAKTYRFLAMGGENPLDLTTVTGALAAVVFLLLAILGAPEMAPLWLFPAAGLALGTRRGLPALPEDLLAPLLEIEATARFDGFAPHVFEDTAGRWHDARLRRRPTAPEAYAGLVALDIAHVERTAHCGTRHVPVFWAITERGSRAECIARGRLKLIAQGSRRSVWEAPPAEATINGLRAALRELGGGADDESAHAA